MPVFEPLRPRGPMDDLTSPDAPAENPAFAPLYPDRQTPRVPSLHTPVISNVGDAGASPGLGGDIFDLGGGSPEQPAPGSQGSFRDRALHRIGVNWATPDAGGDKPFRANPGFYELDYDPRGKKGVELGLGAAHVEAANVFGRQFTREELDKDTEGRKLVKLMEAQRTGAHQEAGFWKGLTDWNLGNTPWLGWMMDVGTTVSEAVTISKTMRKMQNGEAVTDHEALAVRRFMLQQELEGQRSTAYQIGSTIRSSVPFVVEIAGASAMTAGAAWMGAKVGAAIGSVVGPGVGTAAGAAIGAVGGFIFGGGRLLSKAITGGGKKLATKVTTNATMKAIAEKTFAQGISRAERKLATKIAADSTGAAAKDVAKAALQAGRKRALEAIGRELVAANPALASAAKEWTAEQFSAYAAKNAARKEIRRRTVFEASKWTADSFKDVADIAMDAKLARQFLVNKDTVNLLEQGWVTTLERAVLGKSTAKTGAKETEKGFFAAFKGYWDERARIRQNIDKLTPEKILEMKQAYLGATMDKALGRPSAQSAVAASISQSLGGAAVHKGYADEVAEALVDNATRSFMMKYREKGFVNGAHRLARWVGDGVLDGMLRWDTSIYHGAGTMARSGSVLGGKMLAMKEALKASFVEAPVRGTMQLAVQMPIWPVATALAGNSPGDFVVRGQLGTQLTALQTGDKEMMDNARAIAIGSGLVEYISESAGRGFNIFAEGVAGPCLKNAPFVKMTKEVGSYMSRKLEAVFGTAEMMKAANKTKLADAVMRHLGRKSTKLFEETGQALPSLSKDEVTRIVSGAKGIGKIGEVLQRLGLRSEKDLIKDAMVSQFDMTSRRAGITYFVAHNMLEKGWTPQKMAQWMQSVGYDGVISEMMEERYGGFFQGLLGLDDSPSDATTRDRWSAAMRGLFPDPHQLLVEAASFSFPALTQLSMNSLYSRLGSGVVSDITDAAKSVSHGMRTVPALVMPVASEAGAKALADHQAALRQEYEKATVGEGGEEKAWDDVLGRGRKAAETPAEDLPTNAQRIKAGLADGSLALDAKVNGDISNKDVSDGEMETLLQEKAQRIIDLSNTEEELNAQLTRHQAELVFGEDGVEAIKRLWRKDPSHMDSAKQAALGEGSAYANLLKNMPRIELRPDADADTVASEITATLPFVANDAAMTAEVRERLSVQEGVQVNEFSEDYAGEVARNLGTLGDKWLEFKYNLGKHQWWGRRALMRATGIVDAITTGNLELAARNPVQWAIEEAQLPRQLMNDVGQLRERATQAGREIYLRRKLGEGAMTADQVAEMRKAPLADADLDLLEEFKRAGEATYRESLKEYAQMFLAARNVIAVSRGDIEDAALRVVASKHREEAGGKVRYRYDGGTADDFRSPEFRAAVAGEMAGARAEVVQTLARIASSGAIAINTHGRFGNVNTTTATFSYNRAMCHGNMEEVVGAIRAMPAFRNMRAVYDVSDGGHVKDYALGRVVDVGELLSMPADADLDEGSLRQVVFAMGRYYDEFSWAQNQQAARQYLARLRLAVENTEPLSFEFRDGTEAKVTTEYGVDDKGNKVVTLSVNGVSVTAANVYEATKLLESAAVPKADGTVPEAAGVLANWRQVAVLQNDSISSRDATSLALLLFGSRERARAEYERFYGVDGGAPVDERLFPPQLRRNGDAWLYADDEEASRALAAELRSTDPGVRNAVRGTGREGDVNAVGYETAAARMLSRYGIERSKQDAAATDVYRGESNYSIRPNGIAFGDTVYLQTDYRSEGDAELLLRTALTNAIFDAATKKGKVSMQPSEFVGILQEMDKAFTKAAEDAIAELREKKPEMAQRLRDALDSLPSTPGRVNPSRLASIAAAVAVFSDERGVNEHGNGFLFGPELAYIADRARLSPWTQLFISAIDEAVGGYGFFAKDKPPLAGLRRFLDAFSPSGRDLNASRLSALFTDGGEGAKKPGIVFQGYGVPPDMSAAGLASGVAPVIDDSSRTSYEGLDDVNVPLMMERVAANCRAFADAYERAGGTLDNATMYRILKHALDSGGDTAETGAAPSIGGIEDIGVEPNPQARAPLSTEIVPDTVAYGIGRGLQFLSPALFATPAGGVGGRRQASQAKAAVRQFLFERGVYAANVERIWAQFMNAAGAETVADTGAADAAMDEEEWNELAEALSEGSGNQDIFFDAKRQNAAIENKDLMGLGNQWRFVFPSEGGAFTQIIARLFNEVSRLASQDGAPQEMKDLSALFNVLRSPRRGKRAGDRIAAATAVWNDSSRVPADLKNTDYVLAKAVAWLHGAGHDELAFVLNGIRNIPSKGKRRAQALALIGYMTPLDTNYVSVGYDGAGSLRAPGDAGLAAVSSVRASITHGLARIFPFRTGGKPTTARQLENSISALDNLLVSGGSEAWFDRKKGGTPFADKSFAQFQAILARASAGGEAVAAFRADPSDDGALVAFANALAARMSAVADAMDYLLGPGNELTYALRSPDLVGGVVRSIRALQGDAEGLKRESQRLLDLADSCVEGYGSRCPLLGNAILNPAIACIQLAVEAKGGRPSFTTNPKKPVKQYQDITANGLTAADIYSAVRNDDALPRLAARTDLHTQGIPRSKWTTTVTEVETVDADTGRKTRVRKETELPAGVVNSLVGRVFGLYAASAPRSVVRMNGVRSENIEDSSQVTAVPASPAVMAAAIEDRLLAPLGALDDYLARGGRFLDGSRLVVATAGAKLEDGTVVDKAHLSVAVARANMTRFERGDSRCGYFELYHGEKPTVYSVCLPKSVMQKILDGIHSGAEWATNKVVKDLLAKGLIPTGIDDKKNRGHMYDALFSVVASAARCDQIESKRTQVLMAQGVPFSTYRDTVTRVVDGNLKVEDAAVTAMDGKTRVAPGLYCDILVSGTDAAQNLGMYLNHGLLIEAQRAQATNPESVSFKNHLIDWFGSGLFKGQGHDPGIGMHETDMVPVAGTIAEALRIQRRELEETLGIKEGTLDLPEDPDSMTDEEKAYRDSAVELAEAFFRSSTTLCTDVETLKSGPFSTRCGFRYDLGRPFVVKAGGKELAFTFTKGRLSVAVDGNEADLSDKVVVPEDKAGLSLATMLPAIAYALGKKELTAEDVGSIEAEWKLPDGNSTEAKPLKDSGLFQSYGAELGDKVSVVSNASGGFRVKFFTRSMNGQVMANSDASAKPSMEHPAATNWTRDLVANSGRVRRAVPGQEKYGWTATRAVNAALSLPYVALMAQPAYFAKRVEADTDLYAAWKAHPYSQDVLEQLARRANSVFAKAMRPYVCSMHAVLMGSGIKASTSRNADGTYDVTYSYSAGVTGYDKDCFRDARVLTQEEKEAFGVGRSYSSGQVNVASGTFRYGWHLADDADMAAVEKFVDGDKAASAAYAANLGRLEHAYGPADEDMKTVAYLAAFIEAFDGMKGARKEAAAKILGKLFTDYTGKHVGDNASCDLMKVSFSDLFLGDRFGGRRFDLAAFEFAGKTHGKKLDRNGSRTIYLGGAFFAGDRRPSGNFEAAGGLIRVQSPVLFDRATGRVDGHALYILPPLMNAAQGSDTDGDSATGTVMSGRGFSDDDREAVDFIMQKLAKASADMQNAPSGGLARGVIAANAMAECRDRYPEYFEEQGEGDEKVVLPSAKFHQLIANVLLQEEIDNYRLMPNETQTETFGLRDVNRNQGGRVVYDFGLVGRSPVGTAAVSDDVDFDADGRAADVARSVLGADADLSGSYYKVFKRCIDRLSKATMPNLELLNPRAAAYLSGCAADANGARGVMVSLQAALEHLAAYADVDPYIRGVAPALFEERDGYRPLEDFIGHLDKVSNALFDVVKDLFAPRAGWQKGLLNLLVARLVSDANEEYRAWAEDADRQGAGPKWDDEWFFAELVGFARDLHGNDQSLVSLVAKANAFYDHGEQDLFDPERPKMTLLGAYNTMVLGRTGNVAHTAFKQVLLVKDGRLQLTKKTKKPVSGSGQPKITKGLSRFDGASGKFVPAHGDDVTRSIRGLMSGLARALRMTEEDFEDERARDNAVAMGWRPASELFPAGMAERIADVLQGRVDGRTATTSPAEKIAVGMRFLAAADLEEALDEAEATLREMQTLRDLLTAEDGLSPTTAFQRGGSKATGLLDKMDEARQRGAGTAAPMAETYGASYRRLEDIAAARDPLATDRGIGRDMDAVEAAMAGKAGWGEYLRRTGQRPLATLKPDGTPARDAPVLLMAASSLAADHLPAGDVQANRLNLSHVLGCIRDGVQKFGSVQYETLMKRHYPTFAATLGRLVAEALNKGTASGMSKNVVDMLTMLRPDVRRNTVSLVMRASADAAKVLQAGFAELAAYQGAVGDGLSGAGLAACIQLSMCASSQFDPAKDSNVRANVSAMFGPAVDEWERWGAAVPQSPVLRQLCLVERTPNGYDLGLAVPVDEEGRPLHQEIRTADDGTRSTVAVWRPFDFDRRVANGVADLAGVPRMEDDDYKWAAWHLRTPFEILKYIARTEYLPEHDAYRETSEPDAAYLPGGEQARKVTSVYAEGEEHRLRPQTSIPGIAFRGVSREYGTLEEAVNDRIEHALCWYGANKATAMWLADPRNQTKAFNQVAAWRAFADESDREMYESTGVLAPGAREVRMSLNFDEIADEVLERAWTDYGERFSEWAREAALDGGETLASLSSPWARSVLGAFVRDHAEQGLEAPSIRMDDPAANAPFMVQRMKREGFFEFLRDKHPEDAGRFIANPEANIRAALEHVFGDWSAETGCKVERVKGEGGVPVNLLKITRKIKTKGANNDASASARPLEGDEGDDEFLRVQEESGSLDAGTQRVLWQRGTSIVPPGGKPRLERVLSRRAKRGWNGSEATVWTIRDRENDRDVRMMQVTGKAFKDVFDVARHYIKNGQMVDTHDSYDGYDCYLSEDGLWGFAIEQETGNLVSVFSMKKGFLKAAGDFVKARGAKRLDCYAAGLQELYFRYLGFKVASTMDYNMEYDHDGIAQDFRKPNIAFMVASDRPVKARHFSASAYDEAESYQKSLAPKPARPTSIREVATYISFGDYLPMKAANMAYRQAILDELNRGAGQRMTMEQFMSLTEEEQVALANSLGMRVKGESVPGQEVATKALNTRALMALSGLVRLSDVSDYHTLFHEYFHQMLDFYKKTGICTEEDMAELLKKYRTDDGRFDEEAAADAFAEYVGGGRSNARLFTKLSGTGGDEDRVFRKFKHTAQAFLAGAFAPDARGVPAFMKMMISADFSDREMAELKEASEADVRTLERMMLGEDVAFGAPNNWESADGELAQDVTDLARAALGFRQGTHSLDEVKTLAAKLVADGKKPENRVTFEAVMHPDRPRPETGEDEREDPEGPTLAQRISDPSVPAGDRVSLLFKEALDRLGRSASESADLTEAVNRFRDLSVVGAVDGSDMSLMVYTARRALGHACDMLGIGIWQYGADGAKELNELGRQLVSDEKVANFLVRLVHEYSVDRKAENSYELPSGGLAEPLDGKTPAQFASADYVMGRVLADVAPKEWAKFCRGRADAAKDYFLRAAEDLEARAAAARARFPDGNVPQTAQEEARRLELQAANMRHRADGVVRFVTDVMNGMPLKRLIPAMRGLDNRKGWTKKQEESNYYGYILQYLTGAAKVVRQSDGSIRYEKGSPFGFENESMDFSSRYVQEAVDAAAKALGVAQVVRRYAQEAGVDQPAPGESVEIPVSETGEPAAVPPAEGVMEPDLTPQLVLQLPGSWQASDLQKQFYGGSFRDMMTDVSLNAAVEETNRLANRIDFYLGANCMEGESVNAIEEGESDLGFGRGDQEGLFTVEARNRHSMKRVAAVRGPLLGFVNLAAKTKGRPLTREDVNLIHFVGQTVACMANGHGVYTGYDISYVSRRILDQLLADAESMDDLVAATAPGGAYSPEAVAQRVAGHLQFEGRPSNLDMLLNRVLTGIPLSVLGWVPGAREGEGRFRKDGIYCKLLEAFYRTAQERTENGGVVGDADFHNRVVARLVEAGLADKSAATGRIVLVIPAEAVKRAWEDPGSIRTELIEKGGRRAELLDMDYLAEVVAAEANRLNRIAGRSRWLTDSAVGGPISGMAQGLWFEAGTGHHQVVVDHMKNAREMFRGDVSPDERLRSAYGGLQDTLQAHARLVKGPDGEDMLYGDLPAFQLGRDGQLAHISNRQLLYLGRLLGLGRRMADVDTFIKNILAGNFTKEHTDSIFGFDIRPNMTVFEFDRLMFDVLSAHIAAEAAGKKTPLTTPKDEDGFGYGRQELIDVYALHGRLQAKLMDDMQADSAVRGRVCSMSEQDMFRTTGKLGSAKSATERLRSMAEAVTRAERFRGCLAQMLTTVGTDGAPNFVVMPKEGSEGLFPDTFWQATARFVLDRLRLSSAGSMVRYDTAKSGFENMREVAKAAGLLAREKSGDGSHARYHMTPPDDLGAGELFEEIWCADDSANDDVNVLTKFASERLRNPNGSEAEGYLRQLFGSVASPTTWSGWRKLDRVMSYSKAASVGLSAFFAVATRFESPVAACGFWNTVMGYKAGTAKLARRLAGSKVGELAGFAKNMPYLADFLDSITSDDPSIQHMRELCDLINMPLTDSIMNPLTNKQGAIDADIERISRWLAAEGHVKMAAEVRSMMKAAFHNPGEYAFSNVLNGVKMAVVAQTMFRLRKECEAAGRPFDPVRELRKHSAYINAEIGGIQPERYAFLTPGMQQLLRLGMFSYQWTLGAWVAGTGEIVSDMLFGGHHTSAATRQRAFIRWLRMLGVVKVGVPVFMQLAIKSLATALVKSGMVGDPDDPDDKDPLGIDDMPWLCFFNESKVGSLAFDVTPITKLLGRSETLVDIKNKRGAFPFITTVVGTAVGAAVTRKWWGALAGGFAGRNIGAVIPASEGVGRGANTTGRRRQYMHFGKQNDEFWRWFTDGYAQATNKLSIPLQKVVEAFFGSTNGSNFGKKFAESSLTDRFFTTSLDPNESALANFVTGFVPFSAASVGGHPDTGVLGMFGPVNQGTSKTRSQKEIRKILTDFVRDDRHNDPWSFPGNRANLMRLCTLVAKEARMNGLDPDELLTSALGQVTSQEYIRLFDALPKTERDVVDARKAKSALRALYRVNRKRADILQSLKKKYKAAGVDWSQQKNAPMRAAVKAFLSETAHDPWVEDEMAEDLFQRHFSDASEQQLRSVDVQQDRKGGEAFSNFLATDDVPETLFGIPVVSSGYTDEDLEFFRRNPQAAGFYDLGDEDEPPPDEPVPPRGGGEPPPEEPVPDQADDAGGEAREGRQLLKNMAAAGGINEKNLYNELYRGNKIGATGTSRRLDALHARADMYEDAGYLHELIDSGVLAMKDLPMVSQRDIDESGGKKPVFKPSYGADLAGPDNAAGKVDRGGFFVHGRGITPDLGIPAKYVKSLGELAAAFPGKALYNPDFNDTTSRSFALPSKAFAHIDNPRDAREELTHGTTRSLKRRGGDSDAGQTAARNLGYSRGSAYYGLGNSTERRMSMTNTKAYAAQLGMDLNKPEDVARFFRPDTKMDEAPYMVRGLHDAMQQYRKRREAGEPEAAPEADFMKDVGDTLLWKQAKAGRKSSRLSSMAVDGGGESVDRLWADRNPTLIGHVKSFEKLRLKPYEDVGGYAIGYGAHVNYDGTPVTKDTAEIKEAQADAMLARDLYARREALAKALPNWKFIPGAAKQALLDVSMGVNGVLSAKSSPGLHADLAAAGEDSAKLLDAVKRHYYTYRTSKDPKDQKGLENRRVAGGKLFFGEDFSYEGKAWDAAQKKFVPKGGK